MKTRILLIVALALFSIGCTRTVANNGTTGNGPNTQGADAVTAPNLENVEK